MAPVVEDHDPPLRQDVPARAHIIPHGLLKMAPVDVDHPERLRRQPADNLFDTGPHFGTYQAQEVPLPPRPQPDVHDRGRPNSPGSLLGEEATRTTPSQRDNGDDHEGTEQSNQELQPGQCPERKHYAEEY